MDISAKKFNSREQNHINFLGVLNLYFTPKTILSPKQDVKSELVFNLLVTLSYPSRNKNYHQFELTLQSHQSESIQSLKSNRNIIQVHHLHLYHDTGRAKKCFSSCSAKSSWYLIDAQNSSLFDIMVPNYFWLIKFHTSWLDNFLKS